MVEVSSRNLIRCKSLPRFKDPSCGIVHFQMFEGAETNRQRLSVIDRTERALQRALLGVELAWHIVGSVQQPRRVELHRRTDEDGI